MYAQFTTVPLYVAIDIGKNVHCFGGFEGAECRPCGEPEMVHSTQRGYRQFCAWLSAQVASGRYDPIVVGMEPTGIYHEHWAYALAQDFGGQIELRFLNPYQTKNRRKQVTNSRRRKSDALDVEAIAQCLRDNLAHPARLPQDASFGFGTWAASFRRAHSQKQRLHNTLLSELDRLWPGALVNVRAFRKAHPDMAEPKPLVLSHPLQRRIVQILIEFAPDPSQWLSWTLEDVCRFFHSHNLRCGPVTAARLQHVAEEAVLLPKSIASNLIEYLQIDWCRYQRLVEEVERLRQLIKDLVPGTPAAVLTTVPGIGAFLAGAYMAYVVDPARFQRADQIWSLAGFDPRQEESGDWSRLGKITAEAIQAYAISYMPSALRPASIALLSEEAKNKPCSVARAR